MALRGDSYGTVVEITAFTRHLLGGQGAFNSTTLPTVTEIEKFVDRASGVLNSALSRHGLTTPISNSTAKLACDEWVVARATEYVELTQRGIGFTDSEGNRHVSFKNLQGPADKFVTEMSLGFKRLGVGVAHALSEGLKFTGEGLQADREDQEDTTLEQPKFKRSQFDNE